MSAIVQQAPRRFRVSSKEQFLHVLLTSYRTGPTANIVPKVCSWRRDYKLATPGWTRPGAAPAAHKYKILNDSRCRIKEGPCHTTCNSQKYTLLHHLLSILQAVAIVDGTIWTVYSQAARLYALHRPRACDVRSHYENLKHTTCPPPRT